MFVDCVELSSVVLNEGLTSIKGNVFHNCTSLTTINIPASVSSIDAAAFNKASALTTVNIDVNNPNYVAQGGTIVSNDTTQLLFLTKGTSGDYEIPFSVTSIAESALHGCNLLTSLTLNNDITSFDLSYVTGCSSLTIFDVSAGNPSFSSNAGVLYNSDGTELVAYPIAASGAFTIPEGVTSITESAFANCDNLTSVLFF